MIKVYYIAIAIFSALLIYFLFNKILTSVLKIKSRVIDVKKQQTIMSLLRNILKYLIVIITIVIVLNILGINTQTIIAGLSVIGVVIGLAFQDLLKDLIAGIFIVFEDQYRLGETVKITDFKGDVVFLGLKSTKLKSFTGEEKVIPNGQIKEIINYSRENSILLFDICCDYNEDILKVEKIINKLIPKIEQLDNVVEIPVYLGIESLDESYIILRLSITCLPTMQYAIKRSINKLVKEEFDINKIEFPIKKIEVHTR